MKPTVALYHHRFEGAHFFREIVIKQAEHRLPVKGVEIFSRNVENFTWGCPCRPPDESLGAFLINNVVYWGAAEMLKGSREMCIGILYTVAGIKDGRFFGVALKKSIE